MKLSVPFLYEALIVKPRCRKPSLITVTDTVEVEIQEVETDELPLAFRVGTSELRWDGQRLWDFDYHCVSGVEPRKVTLSEVAGNTGADSKYIYSGPGAAAPFRNFWKNVSDALCLRHPIRSHGLHQWLGDADYQSREEVVCREWVDDNRDAVMARALEIAANLKAMDRQMVRPVGEPRYVVQTFGLGNNHGGTGMFVVQSYNTNIPHTAYFSALDYDKACEFADAVAERRGDNESIPVRPNGGHTIEVLIPEAVKVNPAKQHGDGCEFINSIESGINAAGPVGGIAAAFAGLARE